MARSYHILDDQIQLFRLKQHIKFYYISTKMTSSIHSYYKSCSPTTSFLVLLSTMLTLYPTKHLYIKYNQLVTFTLAHCRSDGYKI